MVKILEFSGTLVATRLANDQMTPTVAASGVTISFDALERCDSAIDTVAVYSHREGRFERE